LIITRAEAQEESEERSLSAIPRDILEKNVNAWMDQLGEMDPPSDSIVVNDFEDAITGDSESELDQLGTQFLAAKSFLKQSASWGWLLHRLSSSQTHTSWKTTTTDAIVCAVHKASSSGSREVVFRTAWDPLSYMTEQFGDVPWPSLASSVSVAEGSGSIQAATCGQYASQIWPSLGPDVLLCLQATIDKRFVGNTECKIGGCRNLYS
jgi:hypothetical protein